MYESNSLSTQTIRLADKSHHLNLRLNKYDVIALIFIGLFSGFCYIGWHDMHAQFHNIKSIAVISLNPEQLPYYSLRTTMRLLIGMLFSFIFSLIIGYACAKNKHVARILLPLINFLESAPLIGFLTFTTALFLFLFPKSMMGLEAAAIFAVFTSQAWNMALIFYQALRIIPDELIAASRAFHLNAWQHFWRIELPYAIPGLLWNVMVSQSSAWFALVATEAIPLNGHTVMLPGVGSYIQTALTHANIKAIFYAVLAIAVNVIIFDQLLFRPLVKWSEKLKYENVQSLVHHRSWFYSLIQKGLFIHTLNKLFSTMRHLFINFPTYIAKTFDLKPVYLPKILIQSITALCYGLIAISCIYAGTRLWNFYPDGSMLYLIPLMLKTTLRVAIAMLLSVMIFTPIGIYIGLNTRLTQRLQPIIQIMAALPANIFFPIVTIILIATHQSLNLWTIPLIMLGTQWYVLFNVIAGASALPQDMLEMAKSFHSRGWHWWFKFIIPALFPYIVTGIISAAGGAWNAAIAGEFLQWHNQTISANGLGALIAQTANNHQLPQAALAVTALCLLVSLCVIFIWQPLYRLAETRYKI
ncbi:ABC transporter permease [Piscirickettsia salmonis]|uniref:Bicarbonate transport system permease protein CmpB n=1 Tax=Piscirickettsia salmonis TaxID=1238 RepID=A0A9Q5VI73_PISSA|nr:ABC transporter permease subunit [Piscirickettsia salmonis]ALA23656.1 binding--dependent transport system inner membrane component family protein [Piscirickettsia salmonis]ERL61266.1 binding--dependent transport system inner membrane component family protein [Piscirickettsia salmonis LF-89 = ATCC VR-1361]PEQ16725.1 metal ABC transporter permease [Piscirickettsia salmonis]QGN78829.1 Bicarbonate transport system permease protein CmpB [Piscirickettsia salmonis]QGN82413.1 Bicarbonate transport 